ncbi:hypothetical protein EON82_25850 [bacterium]|nr:MAG: hypothetical protein EON82_25850 [bacterium]
MSIETQAPAAAGELVERPFISITWQKGLPMAAGVNGCRVDDVLIVAAEKLQAYQSGSLACQENADALEAIAKAVAALESRRQRRQEQGVFNTMDAHRTVRTEDVEEDFSATGA